jgi:hypothetical protein
MRSHSCLCVCLCIPPIITRQRLGKIPLLLLGNGSVKNRPIIARQRIGENPLIVARQQLGLLGNSSVETLTTVMNTHATVEELLDLSFAMWPVSYQGK